MQEYVGGYSDWLRHGRLLAEVDNLTLAKQPENAAIEKTTTSEVSKLSYKEQRVLDSLPKKIEQLEAHIAELELQISEPTFYAQEHSLTQPVLDEFSRMQTELDESVERWTELEDRQLQYQQRRP